MSHDPAAREPEYLADATPTRSGGRRAPRRAAILAVTAVGAAGAIAVGGWAAATLMSGGGQPAEALPADVLAYAGVDLDPSAAQKVEAMRIIGKFPALAEERASTPRTTSAARSSRNPPWPPARASTTTTTSPPGSVTGSRSPCCPPPGKGRPPTRWRHSR